MTVGQQSNNITAKNLYIKTYGCQMNVYDSEKMADLLQPHGFTQVDSVDDADLVILNTCHIREKASEKIHSELGRISIKKSQKEMMVVVAGCVAQAEGELIVKRSPCVDIVVGPQSYHNLPELIEHVKRQKSWVMNLDFCEDEKFDRINTNIQKHKHSAFLSIQEGCDKFCHFCVVPYTRGAEYSRSVADIYREAITLASHGCKEITLLGQNVNAYHGIGDDGIPSTLGKLVKLLVKIDGLERIRYTTSHPRDMVDEDLFDAHANERKLMPYIHLPVQSGSDKILQLMNRKHSVEFYMTVIEKFRSLKPDIAFSSDFIVGYPGETENDFLATMQLVKAVNYAQAYSFKYSKRPGTPAAALQNQVSDDEKNDRLQRLQQLLSKQQTAFNQNKVNSTTSVLLERKGKHDDQLIGKSPYMQSVVVNGTENLGLAGNIVNTKITSATQNSLCGEIVET